LILTKEYSYISGNSKAVRILLYRLKGRMPKKSFATLNPVINHWKR